MYHHPLLMIIFQPLCRHRSVLRHHLDCAAATFWMKERGQESVWQIKQNGQEIRHRAASWQHRGQCNMLGVIIDENENDLYTIATRHGILSNKYIRADFTLCRQQLLKDIDINTDKHVSLREAPKWNVQHLRSRICQMYTLRGLAERKKCKCFKAQLKCNNRCHNSLSCSNK